MMTVLFFTGCASSRRQSLTRIQENTRASADSARSVRWGLVMAGLPASAVSLTVPPDSLRKLPVGSAYHARNGQAGLTLRSDSCGNIVAEASCDSLQRLVLWYEEELTRIRGDTVSAIETAETEFKRRFNPVKIALIAFIAGVASGIVSTFLIKRRNGKE